MKIPTAAELCKKLEVAKELASQPVREAVDTTLTDFANHIEKLLNDPKNFTNHTIYVREIPGGAYHGGNYNLYFDCLRRKLTPLGYVVEQSHDGGGVYSTVVIRWNAIRLNPNRVMPAKA